MQKIDFSDYKFRCSALGNLMVNPRSKSELVSETTKSYLLEVYIAEQFKREREIESKYLDKGNYAEEDSLTLVTKQLDRLFVKNKDRLSNDFICGTPDVIQPNEIIDIKTSWDIWSFAKADGSNKDYYYQLQGYMWLTERVKARLVYALVDTPEHLIVAEKSRQAYRLGIMGDDKALDEMETKLDTNMTYSDIPEDLRVKIFEFDYDQNAIEDLKQKIVNARVYLNSLSGL